MGRIRGKQIKNLAEKLVDLNPEKFNDKFEDNKKMLDRMDLIKIKTMRNKVAGYAVAYIKAKRRGK
jgi:ribosomal protein S17E